MPVNQVVAARRVGGLGRSTSKVKWQSWPGRSALSRSSNGPAVRCRTSTPGRELGRRGHVAGDRAGEDVHLHAPLGQALGHLDDVDVQAACVAGPGCSRGDV